MRRSVSPDGDLYHAGGGVNTWHCQDDKTVFAFQFEDHSLHHGRRDSDHESSAED